jgi:hypothetical protein
LQICKNPHVFCKKSQIPCPTLRAFLSQCTRKANHVKPSLVKSKKFVVVILTLLCAAGAWLWFARATESPLAVAPKNTAGAEVIQPEIGAAHGDEQSEHAHEIPAALDFSSSSDFHQREHWYEAAELDANGRYLARATPLELDASCAQRKELAHPTLEAAVNAELGITLQDVTPDDVLVEEIAQFWQQDGFYYQLSGRWDKDMPAAYELNHFRSGSADFSADVEHLPLPADASGAAPTGSIDVLSLGRYIDSVLALAQTQGASPGARLVHALPSAGDETLDLKLNNGRVVSWMFGSGRCQLRTTGAAYCRCVASDQTPNTQTPENKEPYHVID